MSILGDTKVTKLTVGTTLSTPNIKDRTGSTGTTNQVLMRDASGIKWTNASALLPSNTLTISSALTNYDMYANGYRYLTIGGTAYTTSASSNSGTGQATITPSTSDQYVNVSAGYTPKSYIKINKMTNAAYSTSSSSNSGTKQVTITPSTATQYVNISAGYTPKSYIQINAMTNGTWSSNITMSQGQGASVIGTAGYFPVGYGITGITCSVDGIRLSDGTNVGGVAFASYNSGMMFSGTSGVIGLNDPDGVFVAHNVKNVLAQNIASGVTILGVVGTHAGGITPTGNIELTKQSGNDVYSYATASVRPFVGSIVIPDVPTSAAGAVTVGTKSGDYYPLSNTLDVGINITTTGWLSSDLAATPTVKVGSMKGAAFTVDGKYVKTTSTGAGYVPASTTVGTVADGNEGTPIATIGTAGSGYVNVTPSVNNSAGYIVGGPHTGTAVTVYPSNLGLTQRTALTKNGGTVSIPGLSWVSDDALIVTVTPSDVVSGNIELTGASPTDVSAYATATPRMASNFSMTGSAVTDAVTVGTLSSGYYPISAKVKGSIIPGTPGWVTNSGTGAVQASTATQVGKIAASVYSVSNSSNSGTSQGTITPSTSDQYINVTAGYTPKSYVKVNKVSNGTFSSYVTTRTDDGINLIDTAGHFDPCFITGITIPNAYSLNVTDGTNTGTVGNSPVNNRLIFSASTGTIDLYDPDGHFNAFNVKNVSAGNIANGVTILGVTGTLTGGVIDVSSIATLESNLVAANVGKYYRFTGTSGTSGTGTYYINGNIYTYEA